MPTPQFIYVTNNGFDTASPTNNVSVIDAATNTVVATVPVGSAPNGIAVTPDGKHAYVANFDSNTVSVIATSTNTVVATIPVGWGAAPGWVAITPDGKHVFVTSSPNQV